ncbi:MAG: type II toxin-antitoxin system VapC family toxin [Planctomycetota bacterium]|jgi:toxin-antitoxin system PIN domain toxin
MIAVDTNILVYAHRKDSEWHKEALQALLDLAESGSPWGIPWPCVHEFLSITTHPRIYSPPTPSETAVAAIEEWLKIPSCRTLAEGPEYFSILKNLTEKGKIQGPMIHDARIAALCIHHGVKTLWTADRDFSRFPELQLLNPLVKEVD